VRNMSLELRPIFREVLAVHEALRKLGFDADDIFVILQTEPKSADLLVTVCLRTQGIEFRILIGCWEGLKDDFETHWRAAAEAWNSTMSEQERLAIWFGSKVQSNLSASFWRSPTRAFAFRVRCVFAAPAPRFTDTISPQSTAHHD
jgi:hypothetical protein